MQHFPVYWYMEHSPLFNDQLIMKAQGVVILDLKLKIG